MIINHRRMEKHRSVSEIAPKASNATRLIKKIGSGLSAKVYEIWHPKYGKAAMKVIDPSFCKTKIGCRLIKNEIQIHRSLSHPNILKMHEHSLKDTTISIVTNYCEGGDLEKKIHQAKYLSPSYSLNILQGLLQALKYLSDQDIIHRDIKPANILLSSGQPILADFGFAIKGDNQEMKKLNAGSPLYMAPECLTAKNYSSKSDVFAVGVVLFEMLTGKTPWSATSEQDLAIKMKTIPPQPALSCSPQLKQICLNCLSLKSDDRPSIESLLESVKAIQKKPEPIVLNVIQENQSVNLNCLLRDKKSVSTHIKPLTIRPTGKSKQNKICNIRSTTVQLIPKNQVKPQLKIHCETVAVKCCELKLNKSEQGDKGDRFLKLLQQINPNSFTFLPVSLIAKLRFILEKYRRLIDGVTAGICLNKQQEKDHQIVEINLCQSQPELCRVIEGFVRRLYRLTKNYKGFKSELEELEKLYSRVSKGVA